ncbi:MAG: uroporphyrin-III C/tetrapyrrole (Corrin/Porphyrin) methyltransferase, rRNA [Candidatus Parcubacteria bacterium]
MTENPILYVIGTPIGNLEDITVRALRILKEADVIFCEDTRITKRLLERYDITTRVTSINARTERAKTHSVLGALTEGKNTVIVTDAGTPGISDPGSYVINAVREQLPHIKIEAIPGPSALTAALSIAGVDAAEFLFLGFIPHKKGRQTIVKELAETERTTVLYESSHRIMKFLNECKEFFPPNRMMVIARELTKIFEEVVRGTPDELIEYFEADEDKQQGEFVVIVPRFDKKGSREEEGEGEGE